MNVLDVQELYDMNKKKLHNDINMRLAEYHLLAGLIGSAFAGKLPKEAPRIKEINESEDERDVQARIMSWVRRMRG